MEGKINQKFLKKYHIKVQHHFHSKVL